VSVNRCVALASRPSGAPCEGDFRIEVMLDHINEDARILLCGSVATYNEPEPPPGPRNLFQQTTRRAHVHGFMTHLQLPRYDEARRVSIRGRGTWRIA
jgi:NADPH-dependent curcumin reductase CurA